MKPTNSPTQGQPNTRKKRFKVASGPLFPTAINFSWVGKDFTQGTDYKITNPTNTSANTIMVDVSEWVTLQEVALYGADAPWSCPYCSAVLLLGAHAPIDNAFNNAIDNAFNNPIDKAFNNAIDNAPINSRSRWLIPPKLSLFWSLYYNQDANQPCCDQDITKSNSGQGHY